MAVYAWGLDPCFWIAFLSFADYERWAQRCYNQQWLEEWKIAPVHHHGIALLMYFNWRLLLKIVNTCLLANICSHFGLQVLKPQLVVPYSSPIFTFTFPFSKNLIFTFTFFFLRLSFLLPLHTKNFLSGAEIWSDATVQCCLPHVTVSALFTTHEHNSFSCYCQSLLLINLW